MHKYSCEDICGLLYNIQGPGRRTQKNDQRVLAVFAALALPKETLVFASSLRFRFFAAPCPLAAPCARGCFALLADGLLFCRWRSERHG